MPALAGIIAGVSVILILLIHHLPESVSIIQILLGLIAALTAGIFVAYTFKRELKLKTLIEKQTLQLSNSELKLNTFSKIHL